MTRTAKPPMPTPEAYLTEAASHHGTQALSRSGILFYPGSGTDHGPFHLFAENSNIGTVIYADYGETEERMRDFLSKLQGWSVGNIKHLQPTFFGVHDWDQFWPENPQSRQHAGPKAAFALRAKLSRSAKSVDFIFLATEAIQTFSILAESRLLPTILVLQDHGFGGNWAKFGGESKLFDQARQVGLPQLLLVAKNSDPWPGFKQVSKYAVQKGQGQMHNFPRAIFRLVGHPGA